jgi:hypothetical protein
MWIMISEAFYTGRKHFENINLIFLFCNFFSCRSILQVNFDARRTISYAAPRLRIQTPFR